MQLNATRPVRLGLRQSGGPLAAMACGEHVIDDTTASKATKTWPTMAKRNTTT